jgi:hypothetical protein
MESDATSDASPFHQLSAIRARLPTVTAPPDFDQIEKRLQEKGANPRKIGFRVDIPELNQKRTAKSSFLQVRASDGGTLLGLRIYSPGAAAIRLGLLIEHIPAEVSVVFVAADAHAAPAVTAEEITGLIDLNRAAGDDSDEGRTYWSPVVEGEEAVILFHLRKGIDPSELRFSIPRISHILEDPLSSKAAGFCNHDPYGTATYGRFALAYEAGLKEWLNCGPAESRFCDVLPDYWAWPHIQAIADAGITSGCGPTSYCPEDPVTRAQMAVFLLRGIYGGGYRAPAATGGVFTDVPRTYWAAPWIELFAAEGITSGCGGGNYCPDNNVTRAQMAVFLLRSKHGSTYKPPAAAGNLFNDVPSTFWASSWIEQLAAEGITGGCSGGNYCPHESATRAQMAVFIQKTFDLPLPQRPYRLSTR